MLKTVVVGSVSVLLGITSQPSAREQVTATVAVPSQPAAPASTPTDVQQLPQVSEYIVETIRAGKRVQETSAEAHTAAITDAVAADSARTNALKALKLQTPASFAISGIHSRTPDCTFALKMMEVDPNVDSRIRVGAPDGGRARIRRILPPACLK